MAFDPSTTVVSIGAAPPVALSSLDGWTIAQNLTRGSFLVRDPAAREYALGLAAAAVLEHAVRLVGPLRAATRLVAEPMSEPFEGDLDVERTFENALGKEFPEEGDWIVERRQERRRQLVLMMDTSLSMAGANMALAAVAAAVMALKLHPGDLSLIVFESTTCALSHLERAVPPEELVRRMLEQPCTGYTNIEAALELGTAELERGRNPRRAGLLITDGVYTAGGDPLPAAAAFSRLYVMLTEDYKMNPGLCHAMATAGGGDVFRVGSFADLPRRMLDVADHVLR